MPYYYFHLHNDLEVHDDEGRELLDIDVARAEAERGARELMAEHVKEGVLTLSHWIEVQDSRGRQVLAVHYGDLLEIKP